MKIFATVNLIRKQSNNKVITQSNNKCISRSFVILYVPCASIGCFLCSSINNAINKFNRQCQTKVFFLSLDLSLSLIDCHQQSILHTCRYKARQTGKKEMALEKR